MKTAIYGSLINFLDNSEVNNFHQTSVIYITLPDFHLFLQLRKIATEIIAFANNEWCSTSSGFDETVVFGVAMDLLFPEVCVYSA